MKFSNSDEKPILSICVITYNHKKYIEQSLESIFSQETNFACEIIVADDCSNDGTADILRSYASKYPLKLILQSPNKGPGLNWLDLVNAATGKYIAYLEGDDYWTDNLKLQIQVDFLEKNPDLSMCFHELEVFHEDTQKSSNFIHFSNSFKRITLREYVLCDNFIPLLTTVYKNKLVDPFPAFFYQNNFLGDFSLCAINASFGDIGYIPKSMASYRISNTGIWSLKSRLHKIEKLINTYKLLESHFDKIEYKNYLYQSIQIESLKFAFYQFKENKSFSALFSASCKHFSGFYYFIYRRLLSFYIIKVKKDTFNLN